MPAPDPSPDLLTGVPPPDVLRRHLADLTRRRTLVQALLRASVRIANYPPAADPAPRPARTTAS